MLGINAEYDILRSALKERRRWKAQTLSGLRTKLGVPMGVDTLRICLQRLSTNDECKVNYDRESGGVCVFVG